MRDREREEINEKLFAKGSGRKREILEKCSPAGEYSLKEAKALRKNAVFAAVAAFLCVLSVIFVIAPIVVSFRGEEDVFFGEGNGKFFAKDCSSAEAAAGACGWDCRFIDAPDGYTEKISLLYFCENGEFAGIEQTLDGNGGESVRLRIFSAASRGEEKRSFNSFSSGGRGVFEGKWLRSGYIYLIRYETESASGLPQYIKELFR